MKAGTRLMLCSIVFSISLFTWGAQPEFVGGEDTTEPTAEKKTVKIAREPTEVPAVQVQRVMEDFPLILSSDAQVSLQFKTTRRATDIIVWTEIDFAGFSPSGRFITGESFQIDETTSQHFKEAETSDLPWQFIPQHSNRSKGILLWLAPGQTTAELTRHFNITGPMSNSSKRLHVNHVWKTDLNVERSERELHVSNAYYHLQFDLQNNGTLTDISFAHSGKRVKLQSADHVGDSDHRQPDPEVPIVLRRGILSHHNQLLGFLVETPGRFTGGDAGDIRFTYRYLFTTNSPIIEVRTLLREQKVDSFVYSALLQSYSLPAFDFQDTADPVTDRVFQWTSEPAIILRSGEDAFGLAGPCIGVPVEKGNRIRVDSIVFKGRADGRTQPWTGEAMQVDTLLYVGPYAQAREQLDFGRRHKVTFVPPSEYQWTSEMGGNKTKNVIANCMVEMLQKFAESRYITTGSAVSADPFIAAAQMLLDSEEIAQRPLVIQNDTFVALANANGGYLFGMNDGRVTLDAIWHPETNSFVALSSAHQAQTLWRLRLVMGSIGLEQYGEWDGFGCPAGPPIVDESRKDEVLLHWTWEPADESEGPTRVHAKFVLHKDAEFLEGHLDTGPLPAGYGLWEVDFPVVSGIGRGRAWSRQTHLAVPYHTGLRIDAPGLHRFDKSGMLYPGSAGWQFISYYEDRGAGLYLATHDDRGYQKRHRHDPETNALTLRYTHQPSGKGKRTDAYRIPYPCLVGPLSGDWYDAMIRYRSFLLKTDWFPRKTLAEDTRLPKWFKEYPLCIRIFSGNRGQEPGDFVESNLDLIQLLQSPATLVQWYGWNDTKPHMVGRPEQTATPGFADMISIFKKENAHIMPYTCTMLWDVRTESYKTTGGATSAMRNWDGDIVMARYGGQPLAMVSPSHPDYQRHMVSCIKNVLDQIDVPGIYFDLFGTASGGHYRAEGEPWGGNGRTLGMRDLVRKVKAIGLEKNPHFFMAMEGNSDCFLDYIDSYISFTANLPIRQALYGDYVRPFGDKKCEWRDFPQELWYPARHFAWGSPVGRVFEYQLRSEKAGPLVPERVAYYQNLVAYRTVAVPWLCYGRMLEPLKLKDVTPEELDFLQPGESVPHGVWRAPDGTVAFVFSNGRYSVPETSFSYTLDPSLYGIPSDGSWALYRLTPKESANTYTPHFEKVDVIRGIMKRRDTVGGADVLILVAKGGT